MRILFITRAPFGLLGTNASYMFPHYLNKKHEVIVLSPKPNRKEKDMIVFQDDNIRKIQLNNGKVYNRAIDTAVWVDELKPDIVHVFSHPSCFLYPLIYKSWKKNSKVKWYLDIRSHIFGKRGFALLKEQLINSLMQRKFDFISATASESYKSYVKFPTQKFKWVPIGVDVSVFSRKKKSKRGRKKFIFVGSIAKVRKLEVMIEGFGKFLNATKSDSILDLYGGGNAVDDLTEFVKKNGWENNIRFHKPVEFQKLAKFMSDYHAGFVFLPKESFDYAPALKRLEYAAAGIDIIESDTRWNVENPEGFRTFQFENNPESIKDCLTKYVKEKVSDEEIVKNLRKVKRFDWPDIITNEVEPIYKKLRNRK